jgi:excinuclease ABC subunit A
LNWLYDLEADVWIFGERIMFTWLSAKLWNVPGATSYAAPTPNLFSFNSPVGACELCRGFGRTIDIDMDLIIPDHNLTLEEGAIKPWGTWEEKKPEYEDLINFCRKNLIPIDVEFKQLTKEQQWSIIEGTPDYYGIRGFFRWLETKTYKMPVRVYLSRFRSYDICRECHGTRFKKETLLYRLKIKQLLKFMHKVLIGPLIFSIIFPYPKG